MILAAFLIGMMLCALTLSIIKSEDGNEQDKFASAVAMFAGWCAFGMLLMGGTYGLGLVIPGLAAAAVLTLRGSGFGERFLALANYKLPLGVGALICSVATWIGVLNLMEDLPNG